MARAPFRYPRRSPAKTYSRKLHGGRVGSAPASACLRSLRENAGEATSERPSLGLAPGASSSSRVVSKPLRERRWS
jgi:hypothetical protein